MGRRLKFLESIHECCIEGEKLQELSMLFQLCIDLLAVLWGLQTSEPSLLNIFPFSTIACQVITVDELLNKVNIVDQRNTEFPVIF